MRSCKVSSMRNAGHVIHISEHFHGNTVGLASVTEKATIGAGQR